MILTLCPYDDIASVYDSLWNSQEAKAEDKLIMDRIAYNGGSVLDIGCGTGLFLDYYPDAVNSSYVGVDPSQGMLRALRAKHSDGILFKATLESFEHSLNRSLLFDYIISLFGSPSYVDPICLQRICSTRLKPNGNLFLMFYADGYTPVTHQHIQNPPKIYAHDASALGVVSRFNNYVIAER